MRVAVLGGGVSGLAAAHELAGKVSLTVYEKESSLGGHARAVDVDGVLVDPGLMLFNSVTHPNMVRWFEELGVEMEPTDTSLSVSTELTGGGRCGWGWDSSRNAVSGLLARKSNALSPSFWHMIREVLRFQDDALAYLHKQESDPDLDRDVTLGQFVNSHGYSRLFQEAYLIPICACIWPCPTQTGVTGFSAFSVLSFCRNHHLLQIFGRPQWLTVKGRTRSYVNKAREELESKGCRIKTSCRVKSVSSFEGGHRVVEADGAEEVYDKIIFGGHAPDVLRVLGEEATHEELRILGVFQYVQSDIYLHCDESLMPRNPSAWSACNFLGTTGTGVTVTYWLNLLQNIESGTGKKPNFLVTPNPPRAPEHVLLKWNTSHPVPSVAATKASRELRRIHGVRGIWFCGAYQGRGYGFHEDGLRAGKSAAQALLRSTSEDLLLNPKQMVPSWVEAGARLLVTRFLNRYVILGSMILHEQGGTVFSFGQVSRKCHVKSVLRIHDPLFYCKVATEADLGLAMADAYIDGYLSFVDKREGLLNLLLILIANREAHKASSTAASKRAGIASAKYFMRHVSTRRNFFRPYDLGNEFFSLFLDPSMTFSCAIFKAEDESLQVAQQRKVSLLIEKARVERDHHVLEIGNGWGNLALQLVKQTGCKYTGVNLSKEELKYTQMKVKEAGLEDRIYNMRCGYRQIPTDCKYDRIIACEMIEGVGPEYLDDFFGCCESLLAPEGLLVLQFIAIPEQRCDEYRRSSDFVKEYIFPGECLHSLTRVMSAMSAASTLCVEHIENIGYHYYPTQMRWRDNFMAKEEKISALGYDDKFIRTWEYYFAYAAADFKSRMLGNYQIVCSRPGNNKLALADNPYASFPAA